MDEAPGWTFRRSCILLFFSVLLVYATSPVVTNWDSYLSVPTAYSLIRHGDVDLDEYRQQPVVEHYGYYQADGQRYDFYGWPAALFALPAVAAVEAGHGLGIGPGVATLIAEDRMAALQLATASVLAAAVVVMVGIGAYQQVLAPERRRRRVAVGVALAAALATPLWSTASRALWQHGPSMAALALAVVFGGLLASGTRDERHLARVATIVGASVAAAFAVRPSNLVAVLAFSIWIAVSQRRFAVRFLLGATAVAIPFFFANLASYGRLLPPSHLTSGRLGHRQYPEALLANLVSPSRGLLVFTPLALVAVAGLVVRYRSRSLRSFDITLAAICGGHWLLVSATTGWWGGHGYGPRYMSDIVPLLAYLSVPAVAVIVAGLVDAVRPTALARLGAGAIATALVWSVFAHSQGAYFRASTCWNTQPVDVNDDRSRVWDWSDPQFLRGARALRDESLREAVLGGCSTGLGGTGSPAGSAP